MENFGSKLQKQHFAPIFKEALASITEDTLKNGFRVCGLSPFNVENVNFTKIASGKLLAASKPTKNKGLKNELLKELEERMGKNKVKIFREGIFKEQWDGALEDTSLFEIWKDLTMDNEGEVMIQTEESVEKDRAEKEMSTFIANLEKKPQKETQAENETNSQIDIFEASTLKGIHFLKSKTNVSVPFNIPENVPSPFKRAVVELWPENNTIQQNKKRKCKEKIPSVVTSAAWQEYHLKKQNEKKKKQEEKEERARNRENKKLEKNKKTARKIVNTSESSDEDEEWIESGDSLDDLELFEDNKDVYEVIEIRSIKDICVGDYLLAKFPGGKRNTTFYR